MEPQKTRVFNYRIDRHKLFEKLLKIDCWIYIIVGALLLILGYFKGNINYEIFIMYFIAGVVLIVIHSLWFIPN